MSSERTSSLPNKMRNLASRGYLRAHELRRQADDLDEAVAGFLATPPKINIEQLFRVWIEARRLYCGLTGEPLI